MTVQRISQRVDQVSTGDISDVSAGVALSGGGSRGAVVLDVVVRVHESQLVSGCGYLHNSAVQLRDNTHQAHRDSSSHH